MKVTSQTAGLGSMDGILTGKQSQHVCILVTWKKELSSADKVLVIAPHPTMPRSRLWALDANAMVVT